MNISNYLKKNFNLKLGIKRIILLILAYNFINNRNIISYIYGILKSSWYDITVNESEDDICTLSNPFFKQKLLMNDKCISCESVTELRRIFDTTYEQLDVAYLKRNIPVIVSDAMSDWEINSKTVNVENITESYLGQPWIYNYVPCNLHSNLDLRTNFLLDYLAVLFNPLIDQWFIQWKNCELKAVKAARYFYEQTYFTKFYLPAAKRNWILMSNHYRTNKYQKIINEKEKLLMFMQLKGYFKFKLLPRPECRRRCPAINDMLNESEILIFNTDVWNLEYLPQADDLNIAIIVENEF